MRGLALNPIFGLLACLVLVAGTDVSEARSDLPCLTKPQMVVAVGSAVMGVLSVVAVDQGDFVAEGQILATLESSLEQAEVQVARAKAEMEAAVKSTQAKTEFSRRKVLRATDLSKSSAIASHELDEAETEERLAQASHQEALENKKLAQLELQRAEAALALRTIRSPIAGVVVERYLFPGELVRQSPILKLARLDPLRVEVFAPPSSLGKITVGMPAEVQVEGADPGPYHAKVTLVNPVTESATGTFEVNLEIPNPQHRVPAGLPCTVRIIAQ